jgi:hypothetical protein
MTVRKRVCRGRRCSCVTAPGNRTRSTPRESRLCLFPGRCDTVPKDAGKGKTKGSDGVVSGALTCREMSIRPLSIAAHEEGRDGASRKLWGEEGLGGQEYLASLARIDSSPRIICATLAPACEGN